MSLVKSNGTRSLSSLFSDFFDANDFFAFPERSKLFTAKVPAVNISESDKAYNVELAAPGMKKEDFKVTLNDDMLTISASQKKESEEKTDKFTRQEFNYTSFTRSFTLPENAMAEGIIASYTDGLLKLEIPKTMELPKTPPKEINIG
ncbi:MAG: Hsp20/alpha crystallin family protein [Bacteriodetes bacterium]|nr:Hsp20/alpha crystallin family protein [Bacteroidota bacterium]